MRAVSCWAGDDRIIAASSQEDQSAGSWLQVTRYNYTMEKFLALVATCCVIGALAQGPCADIDTQPTVAPIPLPDLPVVAFKTVLRVELIDQNETLDAVEYVDETLNMASVVVTQKGQTDIVILSFNTGEVFYISPSSAKDVDTPGPLFCITQNLTADDNSLFFGMADTSSGTPHLFSTSKILDFINGSEIYQGQTTVSGIPVNRWSSCQYWPEINANFSLDYYFTVSGWQTPSGLDQVPVQAEVQGIKTFPNGTVIHFHRIYQYVNFQPYVKDPEAIFTTPSGVYCLFRQPGRPLPALQNHFYFREEISSTGFSSGGFPTLMEVDIWYDYDLKMIRFDQRWPPGGIAKVFDQSHGPFTVIHDYNIGVQYTMATDLGECSIDPIPNSNKAFDAAYNLTGQLMNMRTPMEFFNLDSNYIYTGVKVVRGQQCDVFQTMITNYPGHEGIATVYEIYFLAGATDITDRGEGGAGNNSMGVPMRVLTWETGELISQYDVHDFDQSAPLSRYFDVTPCFPGQASIDFEIFLSVQSSVAISSLVPYLHKLLLMSASVAAGVSPLRIQRTRLHWDDKNVYYEGTLLDAAPSIEFPSKETTGDGIVLVRGQSWRQGGQSAKYQATVMSTMLPGSGKLVHNIQSVQDCAAQCDHLQEWDCIQFDYCSNTQACTLGIKGASLNVTSNQLCDHYERFLGRGWSEAQISLAKAWLNLKDGVYRNQISFSLPLPDENGFVDLSLDVSQLDSRLKATFTAYFITDQVVSSVNRNPQSANVMTQFQSIPQKSGKGYDTLVRGVSVDDCASSCIGELTYDCQSFHYCWDAGTCFLSRLHPDESPNLLKNSTACDLYIRNYTSNFQKFNGITVLSNSNATFQNVPTPSQCAKFCMQFSSFHCESFDYCSENQTCSLGQAHYYDTPLTDKQQTASCSHYSRNYIQDFVMKSEQQVPLRDNRIVQNVTAAQCAKLCAAEPSFSCNSFDYCTNITECRLSDVAISPKGEISLEASAYCDVYMRRYGTSAASVGSSALQSGGSSDESNSSGFSGGALAGLGFGMVFLGVLVGLIGLYVYARYFGNVRGLRADTAPITTS